MHAILFHQNYLTYRKPNSVVQRTDGKENGGWFRRWLGAAALHWQRRKMIAAFEAMDERLLRDIGIYRGDIPRVVDGFSDRELRMAPLAPPAKPVETYDDVYRKAA